MIRVALLQRGQQERTVGRNRIDEVERLRVKRRESVVRQRRRNIAEHAANIHAGRPRLDEQAGIDGRVEQGELPRDALDVLAMAQLDKTVGHSLPVTQQLVVGRNLEIEGLARRNAASASASARPAHQVLNIDEGIREGIHLRFQLVGTNRRRAAAARWPQAGRGSRRR